MTIVYDLGYIIIIVVSLSVIMHGIIAACYDITGIYLLQNGLTAYDVASINSQQAVCNLMETYGHQVSISWLVIYLVGINIIIIFFLDSFHFIQWHQKSDGITDQAQT